ncbi:MAG: VWA domain-containing protein [Candidatus Schekmanbacteria bacterium]|nr:VWA domain-containing protein [Candidatus Schekmanbacteria bacterium]
MNMLRDFAEVLRRSGIGPSPAELIDAVHALTVVGFRRDDLKAALAATLVKQIAHRKQFFELFDDYFKLEDGEAAGKGRRQRRRGGGGGEPRVSEELGLGGRGRRREEPPERRNSTPSREVAPRRTDARGRLVATLGKHLPPERSGGTYHSSPLDRPRVESLSHRRLLHAQLSDLTADDSEEARALAAFLARRLAHRLRRRTAAYRRGVVDIRGTVRRSLSRGGALIEPRFRRRRRRPACLLALCDVSFSVRTAADLFMTLLAPARMFFRSVQTLAFVDKAVPFEIENGRLVFDGTIDLDARSDYGRALKCFWEGANRQLVNRDTVVLFLGDARANRLPPRPDLLAQIATTARCLLWLNPERVDRWNMGDSMMAAYARYCDAVICCDTLEGLVEATRTALLSPARGRSHEWTAVLASDSFRRDP